MVDILKTRDLPNALTSYDVLKTLALLLMFVDHAGYFFFPEEAWFRVIGRLSVPIWFFLIGFANTRDVPRIFWAAAVVVLLSALMAGEYLLPVNIIFTLIFARMAADWLYSRAMRNKEAFIGMFFFLFFLAFPSLIVFEYGTLGFMFALFGTICRQRENFVASRWMIWAYMTGIALAYIVLQSVMMKTISVEQFWVLGISMAALMIGLYHFKPVVFENAPRMKLLQIMGRRTLEIYALHLIVVRAVVMFTDPERFSFLDFNITAFPHLFAFLLA